MKHICTIGGLVSDEGIYLSDEQEYIKYYSRHCLDSEFEYFDYCPYCGKKINQEKIKKQFNEKYQQYLEEQKEIKRLTDIAYGRIKDER